MTWNHLEAQALYWQPHAPRLLGRCIKRHYLDTWRHRYCFDVVRVFKPRSDCIIKWWHFQPNGYLPTPQGWLALNALGIVWILPNSFKYQDCIVIAATLLIWSCWLNISAASHAYIICVLVVYGSTPPYLCHTSSICACSTSRCLLLNRPKLTRMFLCNKNLPG